MVSLTPKEQKLFQFIEKYQLRNGKSPTVREMRQHMGLKSDGFVVYLMNALNKKGAIQRRYSARHQAAVRCVKTASDLVQIPYLVRACGWPCLTENLWRLGLV